MLDDSFRSVSEILTRMVGTWRRAIPQCLHSRAIQEPEEGAKIAPADCDKATRDLRCSRRVSSVFPMTFWPVGIHRNSRWSKDNKMPSRCSGACQISEGAR